ncbi:MAG: hypothetical protein K1Y02_21970, partial [Candidatus Hydrogenedentes bacterium]|nr:hypothetical protein [Candidatus Hydrogenedentota bacterium]
PSGDGPVTLKAIHATLWRGVNGDAGILIANADTEAHAFTCTLDMAQHGFTGSKWRLESVTTAESKVIGDQDGSTVSITVDVPARDAVLLRISPTQG